VNPKVVREPSVPGEVCALIVTYHPDSTELKAVLRQALHETGRVIVVDNSTEPLAQRTVTAMTAELGALSSTTGAGRVHLIANQRNEGLSRAYNQGLRQAKQMGARFVLLLDQDSVLEDGAIASLLRHWNGAGSGLPIGALSCNNLEEVVVNVGLEPIHLRLRNLRNQKEYLRGKMFREGHLREVKTFTNSGTLLPMAVVDKVGPFDEALFLDAIDYDYSLRLRSHGYRLLLDDRATLRHRQGKYLQHKILGRPVNLRTYSPLRSYWIERDTLQFASKWFSRYPGEVTNILAAQISGTVGAIPLLDRKRERFQNVLRAFSDFGHHRRLSSTERVETPVA
jgi:rhamnosyltransferase